MRLAATRFAYSLTRTPRTTVSAEAKKSLRKLKKKLKRIKDNITEVHQEERHRKRDKERLSEEDYKNELSTSTGEPT